MKNTFFSILFLSFFALTVKAQVPQAFKYQAVVRDAAGLVMANQNVGLKINLIQQDTVYIETHQATTNAFGLVNLEVGRGTVQIGDFSQIDWSFQTYIQVWLDATGGANYEIMGFTELLSVPYALYAANGGSSDDDADPTNELQTLSQTGSEVTLSNGGGMISVNDADADPANELELPANSQKGDLAYHDGTAWQRIAAGAPGAVLTIGADGLPIWYEPRQDFYGTYLATEICNGSITLSWTMTISAQTPGNFNEVSTNNLGDYGLTLPGTVDGNVMTINTTDPGSNITVNGTFTLTGNMLSFTYTASNSVATDNCTGTATKQ